MNTAQKHALGIGAVALALCALSGSVGPAQGESWTVVTPEPAATSPTTPARTYPTRGVACPLTDAWCREVARIQRAMHPAPSPWTVITVRPTR